MYLGSCISYTPAPGIPAFWPHLTSDNVTGLMKKGQNYNISEILHPGGHLSSPVFAYGLHPRPMSPPSPGSGLAPLQALCASGGSILGRRERDQRDRDTSSSNQLKFGISRILSEEFGKNKQETGSSPPKRSPPHSPPSRGSLCPCNSLTCSPGHYPHLVYPSSLSAVHALQPPQYPLGTGGSDSLPGPYSILSADSGASGQPKRKRSWSRAVFSNLQRKGLEKRFEVQKYVTKPDRRQLAAMLGLTDAQVKVWFQNRRMKWRHAQQQKGKDGTENDPDGEPETKEEPIPGDIEMEADLDSDHDSEICEKEEEVSIDSGVEETDNCTVTHQDDIIDLNAPLND